MVLNVVFFALRLWVRKVKAVPADLDDWFLWAVLIVNLAVYIEAICLINAAGVGYYLSAVKRYSPYKLEVWSKGIYACVLLWALAVALLKLSILGFYVRFFMNCVERGITHAAMLVVAATFFATGIMATFQCSPVAYQWDKKIAGENASTSWIFTAGCSFPTSSPMCHDAFEDNTWTSVELLNWTDIEPGIYFLAACMHSLRPSLRLVRDKTLGSTRSNQNDNRRREGGRDDKRNGFARLAGGGDVAGKDVPGGSSVAAVDSLPEDGIAVRKEIY